jgi:hypothetical protein
MMGRPLTGRRLCVLLPALSRPNRRLDFLKNCHSYKGTIATSVAL